MQKDMGLIHLYCGDGKGKTTAAAGLTLRAAGAGKRVIFAQFFKDGSSSEVKQLSELAQVTTMNCRTVSGRFSQLDTQGREQAKTDYSGFLEEVFAAASDADLLALDEVISACSSGTVSEGRLEELLNARPEGLEVVLTGRDPSPRLLELADYVTEMRKIKHPYDRGIMARHGVEY